jgi:hypothetical protein
MQILIQLFTLIRIRIQLPQIMRIRIPNLSQLITVCVFFAPLHNLYDRFSIKTILNVLFYAGLRIRIHFIRIRIQHFSMNTNPDPDPIRIWIQGFNDQKLKKKIQLKKN